ncbi:MAG: DNA repair protein RadC [Candidatus Latescibacterota bacterium]|nr:MAG: DNA repair protein RadC [Candidatus Latescibacterota bacterium]
MKPLRTVPAGPLGARRGRSEERPAARHLSNRELLTLVLDGFGGGGAHVADLLLRHFGSLRGLSHASCAELLRVPSTRPEHAARVEACLELGRRLVYGRPLKRGVVDSPERVARLLMPALRDLDREHFVAVLLTTKNQVIDVITVSIGSLSASLVHPREVLKPAIQASAAALIVAHNHPTGIPEPSREDIEFTQRLGRCCDVVGIRLLDHVIIGDGAFESLKASGHF